MPPSDSPAYSCSEDQAPNPFEVMCCCTIGFFEVESFVALLSTEFFIEVSFVALLSTEFFINFFEGGLSGGGFGYAEFGVGVAWREGV